MGTAGVKRWVGWAALLALAACAAPAPPAPAPVPTPVVAPATPPPPPTPRPSPDQCGASDLQSLVGRPKVDIPIPLEPGRRRVLCTTCPMTRDYVVGRQTILFDAETGLVTSVTCG